MRQDESMVHLRVGPLIRATSPTSVVIWAECSQACIVTLCAVPQDASPDGTGNVEETKRISTPTTNVGGRFFAAPQLHGLTPSTWYTYHLVLSNQDEEAPDASDPTLPVQCFRTFASSAGTHAQQRAELRLAYGSCRKLIHPPSDAFNALGRWLIDHFEMREQIWPHALLLIGDQIYADEPAPEQQIRHPQLRDGAKTFADFALMYEEAWTCDTGVRQALAVLPTYMIFDDHEISNDWNTTPTWRANMLRKGMEHVLVDGLLAYWVYQGWGNLERRDTVDNPLLCIMHEAALSGEDALSALRACIKADLYQVRPLPWHYQIRTQPPVFVFNARTERTTVLADKPEQIYGPTRIVSQEQMNDLRDWLRLQETNVALLVSSIPALLPPLIGLAEYLMGRRLWHQSGTPLHQLGVQLARMQQRVIDRNSFDHWPIYAASWDELVEMVTTQPKDILILSGDVHFSYALEAHGISSSARAGRLYQLVSTPLQNMLGAASQRKIELQGHITHATYGGLHTRILPLLPANKKVRVHSNLLFENTLALLTLQPQNERDYAVKQEYLGVVDGHLETIAHTTFPTGKRE